jgi:hypothetical protein
MSPRPEAPAALLCRVLLAVALAGGCARSPLQLAWERDVEAARRDRDVARLDALAAQAPRAVDEAFASFEAAEIASQDQGEVDGAHRLLKLAHDGPRRLDRARARLKLASLAEARGRLDLAERLWRALLLTYPDLMPGERALALLLRHARAADASAGLCQKTQSRDEQHYPDMQPHQSTQIPPQDTPCTGAVDRHLDFTRRAFGLLHDTPIADDVLFQAATEAMQRGLARSDGHLLGLAERLYRRVLTEYPRGGHWDDAMWQLSWIHHARGAWRDEIAAIEAIQRRREEVSFFGQNEHPYFYLGQRRVARLLMVELDDPARARAAWHTYADVWTRSIHRDDAWFFAACCASRLGDLASARADLARIATERPESRHLRHADLALTDPRGPRCTPPELTP